MASKELAAKAIVLTKVVLFLLEPTLVVVVFSLGKWCFNERNVNECVVVILIILFIIEVGMTSCYLGILYTCHNLHLVQCTYNKRD